MNTVDFRSDTVTWPTPRMWQAMSEARIGDDVYGEDPTVNELQDKAAAMLDKEAALFVASGTMGNLVGILAQATRGDQIFLGADAHSLRSEAGSMAALGGVIPRSLPTDDLGMMKLCDLEAAISPDDPHYPRNRLIALENTYSAKQGTPQSIEYFSQMRSFADKYGLTIHLDGARLFNASVALELSAADIVRHVDTVSFCLSKGLCAPIGSVVCGSGEFIHEARRIRKALGGGMRQAGIMAAAGIVAIEEMIDRLSDDHQVAKYLAKALSEINGIRLKPGEIRTNIVMFELDESVQRSAAEVTEAVRESSGILLGTVGPRAFRAVTHYWVGLGEAEQLLEQLKKALPA